MPIIYAAATLPVNPAGEETVLTLDQLWKGLDIKVRKPQLFLPLVEGCEVLTDDGDTVTRVMKFKPGFPQKLEEVKEKITKFKPINSTAGSGVETFEGIGGPKNRVLNIVSQGPSGKPDDLWLTFTFEWDHPKIETGSLEEAEKQASYQKTAPTAVGSTLNAIREMVKKGELFG